jgi:hypothetical protein
MRLWLGEREITVQTGEAAEFATMTPHAFTAIDGPAELIMIFDRLPASPRRGAAASWAMSPRSASAPMTWRRPTCGGGRRSGR